MAGNTEEKNKIGIVLAIVAGLLALGMTFVFLKKLKDTSTPHTTRAASYAVRKILAATGDLPSGHIINANSDLREISVPYTEALENFVNNCVAAEHAQEIHGRRLGTAVPAQYPVMYSNLLDSYSLDEKFKEGYLKTIELSSDNFFSSYLIPGDRVDVLVTMPKKREQPSDSGVSSGVGGLSDLPQDQASLLNAVMQPLMEMATPTAEVETKTILENVEVLMVGSMMKGERMQFGFSGVPQENESREVTFRLNKSDAIMLTQYVNTPNAKISLLLRPRISNTATNP